MAMNDVSINLERGLGDELPAEGLQDLRLTGMDPRTSKKGEQMFLAKFEIISGPDAEKTFLCNLMAEGRGRFKLDQFLDAIAAPVGGHLLASKLIGVKCRAQIGYREYNNRKQVDIVQFLPAVGGAGKILKADGSKNVAPKQVTDPGKKNTMPADETMNEVPF